MRAPDAPARPTPPAVVERFVSAVHKIGARIVGFSSFELHCEISAGNEVDLLLEQFARHLASRVAITAANHLRARALQAPIPLRAVNALRSGAAPVLDRLGSWLSTSKIVTSSRRRRMPSPYRTDIG